MFAILSCLLITSLAFAAVPLNDNILLGFERCKTLTVDLEKGLLKESVVSSFDIHCKQEREEKLNFQCSYFEFGSNKKISVQRFSGGSELGVTSLKNSKGDEIKFLIGKKFAAYKSGSENKVCAGIFIFEKEALKQKASSPKFD
jgi:hypothetical protein